MSSNDLHDCTDCPLTTRLDFLKQMGLTIAGTSLLLNATARDAKAFAIRTTQALAVRGDEVVYDIPTSDGATIDKDNQVILVRTGTQVYAFALTCPHQNTALRWLPDEHVFQCPKHKSRYQLNGTFISGRATRSMDRLPIRKQDAHIVVNTTVAYQEDKDAKQWSSAVVTLDTTPTTAPTTAGARG